MSSLPAAASVLLRPLLEQPARSCPVVASSRTGIHVATGDGDVPVLSIIATGGARLPGACVLASPHPPFVDHGHLVVGDGTVGLADFSVRVLRWWAQPVVAVPDSYEALRAGADALTEAIGGAGRRIAPEIAEPVDRLSDAVRDDDVAEAEGAVHAMVGLGPGLTPAADDVLVGALLGWHHLALAGWDWAAATGAAVGAAVRHRLDRTGAVSAALLYHATRGIGVSEALLVLDALRTPDRLPSAVDALQQVGHDSGPSVLLGIEIALGAVLGARRPERVAP